MPENSEAASTPLATEINGEEVLDSQSQIDQTDWLEYRNEFYGFTFNYPPSWTLEESNHKLLLQKPEAELLIHFRFSVESVQATSQPPFRSDLTERETVEFLATQVPKYALSPDGVDKDVYYGEPEQFYQIAVNNLVFENISLFGRGENYAAVSLSPEIQLEVDQIFKTFKLFPGSGSPEDVARDTEDQDSQPESQITDTPLPSSGNKNSIDFISDVNVWDGTVFSPGETFTKTWRIKNDGDTIWTTDYSLAFFSGDQMGAADIIPLKSNVSPGDQIDVSVDLIAPDEGGDYIGFWLLRDADGKLFGVEGTETPFWVSIKVRDEASSDDDKNGDTPNSTTDDEGVIVNDITLSASPTSYEGDCPVTLNLSGEIETQGIGTYTYELVTGTDTTGFQFFLPAPIEVRNYGPDAISRSIVFQLELTSSVDGWAQVKVVGIETATSGRVNFSIECE
jgi:hypothetical protein